MEFGPGGLAELKDKIDISQLTLKACGQNHVDRGMFYCLWRNGHCIFVQAEPFCRPDIDYSNYYQDFSPENTAYNYVLEVLQTMLDQIEFGRSNWAYLVRQKDGMYRLIYKNRRLIKDCEIWTKTVDLLDIEVTKFLFLNDWIGKYEGREVDLLIGWDDSFACCVTMTNQGHKTMCSLGLSKYTYDLIAHVTYNGLLIGLMTEAALGRQIIASDRAAVYEAVADIQSHGILHGGLLEDNIYVTDQGIRFTNLSAVTYYHDRDELAKEAEILHWKILARIFDVQVDSNDRIGPIRNIKTNTIVIPRLPTPDRPLSATQELAMMHLIWSIYITPMKGGWKPFCDPQKYAWRYLVENTMKKWSAQNLGKGHENKQWRHRKKVITAPRDVLETEEDVIDTATHYDQDEPLAISLRSSKGRLHPYHRPALSKKIIVSFED
ncbi:hypothetical protein SERLA73DRAFT_176533 [Serpula lacrymans var. lacrymans S7.3]|uniref:Uncharacterized protein n=2 Tax=Serpula lacrymans var. lacrymans TaxID=341189 RepID=F8PN46_SERL3|nr:uncharacterized protein SERLADRAFT_459423 [Serpula lacrymans var. lacrymans S7.9]EGO03028.1 hypothetical protein SERLA73DRAFT_176533 [Serpula lacrymans var. lacrymans S7.3]EGO28707.1 hypothetical protein SERLADRAFT_459423 [Serpula lacrymans var. lacrymans S7.9]